MRNRLLKISIGCGSFSSSTLRSKQPTEPIVTAHPIPQRLGRCDGALGGPAIGHQLLQTPHRPTRTELLEHIEEAREGLDAVELRRLDDRVSQLAHRRHRTPRRACFFDRRRSRGVPAAIVELSPTTKLADADPLATSEGGIGQIARLPSLDWLPNPRSGSSKVVLIRAHAVTGPSPSDALAQAAQTHHLTS